MQDLEPFAVEQLNKLNDPEYLVHRTGQITHLRHLKEDLPTFDTVEIGTNRGRFLTALAEADPQRDVLGLEWREKWVNQLVAQKQRIGLDNLHVLRADARIALPILIEPKSVKVCFILYPDPWWKKKHVRRRLIDPAFLNLIGVLLREDGMLIIKTDALQLRDYMEAASREQDGLVPLPPWEWPDEREWGWSQRERGCMADGTATYRLYYGPPTGS